MENQGHVVLYEKLLEKNNLFEDVDITLFLIFENFLFFLLVIL